MAYVFTCDVEGTPGIATCPGSGTWVEYQPAGEFDAVQYFEEHGAEWGQYFGAGFTFVSIGIVVSWMAMKILQFIRDL